MSLKNEYIFQVPFLNLHFQLRKCACITNILYLFLFEVIIIWVLTFRIEDFVRVVVSLTQTLGQGPKFRSSYVKLLGNTKYVIESRGVCLVWACAESLCRRRSGLEKWKVFCWTESLGVVKTYARTRKSTVPLFLGVKLNNHLRNRHWLVVKESFVSLH